jgi:hypothetical protein
MFSTFSTAAVFARTLRIEHFDVERWLEVDDALRKMGLAVLAAPQSDAPDHRDRSLFAQRGD